MEAKGKFIVLEGIEGCGKGTQTKLLSDFLSQKYEVLNKRYPDYGTPIGDLLSGWLHKKYDLSPDVQALLYLADFSKDKELVEKYRESGKMVLDDRYFTSTIVYQRTKGVSIERLLKLAELCNLPKPDICIYIKISPETSFERKATQKGVENMDRHEEDKKFLKVIYDGYESMAKDNIFCDWAIVDGEKSVEEVFDDIKKLLNEKLGI